MLSRRLIFEMIYWMPLVMLFISSLGLIALKQVSGLPTWLERAATPPFYSVSLPVAALVVAAERFLWTARGVRRLILNSRQALKTSDRFERASEIGFSARAIRRPSTLRLESRRALQKEFLTRRANQQHNGIIARIPKLAPATAAGFLVSFCGGLLEVMTRAKFPRTGQGKRFWL